MAVTRFKLNDEPDPPIGKADFEWFYSGTLQTNDNNRIPVKTKIIDVYINRLDVVLYTAATDSDFTNGGVIVEFFKNGVSLGTVRVVPGTLEASTVIAKTLVTAGDKMTAEITQVGASEYGITMSAYARVAE